MAKDLCLQGKRDPGSLSARSQRLVHYLQPRRASAPFQCFLLATRHSEHITTKTRWLLLVGDRSALLSKTSFQGHWWLEDKTGLDQLAEALPLCFHIHTSRRRQRNLIIFLGSVSSYFCSLYIGRCGDVSCSQLCNAELRLFRLTTFNPFPPRRLQSSVKRGGG